MRATGVPATYLSLRYMEIPESSKIRVFSSGTLSRSPELENFATVSRQRCQQNASMIELVDHTCDGRHATAQRRTLYIQRAHSLLHEIRGSHHRCSCLPPLAARPGADRFQGRCADVQSFTWKCAALSGTIRCCCQSARPTDITLWWHQSSDCAIRQTFNSR